MEGYDGGVDESSQLCWREVGQPEDGHDIHSQQVTQPNTIFPSPGQHKVGGQNVLQLQIRNQESFL